MRFSARYRATTNNHPLVLEDAPRPTRIGFIKGILGDFVGNQSLYNKVIEPLETSEVHQKFIALIRDEAEPWDYDNESSWGALTEHLKSSTWLEFYDFVELVGKLLAELDKDPFSERRQEYFKQYQAKLNALLEEDGIGWSLNENSELTRQIPKSLSDRVSNTEKQLANKYDAARIHYSKAIKYLYQHPIDEANSIKEIVSALESVARVLHPDCATLGDAIKVLKKQNQHPKHLIDSMERLYVYSNATPLVRHGHASAEKVSIDEAELALHIGVAFIRYLINTAPKNV
ncbi:MAG: hypothetical protein V4568_15030 [Pseudomonadota bacterium]